MDLTHEFDPTFLPPEADQTLPQQIQNLREETQEKIRLLTGGKLVLLRHGESEGNHLNIYSGHEDFPLTEKGKAQAEEAANILLGQEIIPQKIFASSLKRAIETAEIIIKKIRVNIANIEALNITKIPEFNERCYGTLEGMQKTDISGTYHPAILEIATKHCLPGKTPEETIRLWRRGLYCAPPEGESIAQVMLRTGDAFLTYLLPHLKKGKTALLASHGVVMRSLLYLLNPQMKPEEIESIKIPNAEPRIITFPVEKRINI